jgi:hypothetical protein
MPSGACLSAGTARSEENHAFFGTEMFLFRFKGQMQEPNASPSLPPVVVLEKTLLDRFPKSSGWAQSPLSSLKSFGLPPCLAEGTRTFWTMPKHISSLPLCPFYSAAKVGPRARPLTRSGLWYTCGLGCGHFPLYKRADIFDCQKIGKVLNDRIHGELLEVPVGHPFAEFFQTGRS